MHFKSVALLALASVAIASPNGDLAMRQVTVNPTEASVLAVLATALPASLVNIGITNPAEVGAIIASSFSAGNTPSWYSALPSDVKSYLPVLYAEATATSASLSSTPAASSSASASSAVVVVLPTSVATVSGTIAPSGNSTVVSTVRSATLSTTTLGTKSSAGASSGASSAASHAASSTSTGGASYPTAVMGAGIAGAIGFLGMLAM